VLRRAASGRVVGETCGGVAGGDPTDGERRGVSTVHGCMKFLGMHLITGDRHHPPGSRPSDLKQFAHAAPLQ
jgi:hypothetical protein